MCELLVHSVQELPNAGDLPVLHLFRVSLFGLIRLPLTFSSFYISLFVWLF